MNVFKSALVFLIVVIVSKGYAQNNCPQVLKKAQDTYDEGRISEVSDMLEGCLKDKNGFTKEERIAAYKLLTLTWLYFNERTKAEEAMHNFLVLNPEYEINEALDPTEFINLYNSFRTSPVLIYGVRLGVNGQDVNVIKNFSLDNAAVERGKYKSKLAFQFGLTFEIPVKKKFSVLTELNFVKKSYQYSDEILGFAKQEFLERQTLLEVPIMLHFNLSKKKFIPYFNVGHTFGLLIADKATVTRKDNVDGTQQDVPGPDISVVPLRRKMQYSISVGAGFKWKNIIGNGYILCDVRYNIGIRNIVNPENRYSNTDLVYSYLYIDNNYRLSSLVGTIGFALPTYKPKIKVSKKAAKE